MTTSWLPDPDPEIQGGEGTPQTILEVFAHHAEDVMLMMKHC